MPATSTDRLNGLTTSVAVKAPVRSVSTDNLTLAGEQTVNGVALAGGDRVLVKDQAIASENGIYVVSTGSWERAKDFDGNRDVVKGTLVVSNDGSGSIYHRVTTANPITIGTTAINFEVVSGVLTQSIIGGLLYPQTSAESSAGVTPVDYAYQALPIIDVRRYGYIINDENNDNAAGNDIAIAAAIAVARQVGGAAIVFPPGIGRTLQPIEIFDGVYLVGAGGEGTSTSQPGAQIRYMGGEFVDVVRAAPGATQGYGVRRMRLLGGLFQQGTARYGFYAEHFHRGCLITECVIRDCVGVIRIESGYYGHAHHNQFGPVTPSQAASGVTDGQWIEVFGAASSPVYFGDCNGSDLSHNRFQQLAAEASTGGQPVYAIHVSGGEAVNCRHWIIESTGVDLGGFSPRVTYCVRNTGIADFSGMYVELVGAQQYFLYAQGESVTTLDGFIFYNMSGATCFYNDAFGDMVVSNGKAYRMNFARAWFNLATGLGAGGAVKFENVSWFSGERRTDAAINADADNVFDTAGTAAPLGATDGTIVQGQHRRIFPRQTAGLVVTAGADGDGPYIQVTCGTLLSEFGDYVHIKFRTGPQRPATGNMPVQRLRPVTASKWYRVWVGRYGGAYLVQHDAEPTTPYGDWIAEFQTNGGGAITGLVNNPRLGQRGIYVGNSAIINTTSTSSPSPGKSYASGDEVRTTTATTGQAIGWRYDGSAFRSLGTLS